MMGRPGRICPTLEDKATWLGSSSVIYKGDTVDVQRAEDHSVTGKLTIMYDLYPGVLERKLL